MLAASAPATRRHAPSRQPPSRRPRTARRTDSVLLFDGCVMPGLFPHVQRDATDALESRGARVAPLATWHCCGALHAHAGDLDGARRLARRVIEDAERLPDAPIVCTSAGCGAMLEGYAHLFADDPAWRARAERVSARTCDVTERLHAMPAHGDVENDGVRAKGHDPMLDAAPRTPRDASAPPTATPTIAYSPPCHLLHAQRVALPPEALLDACGGRRVPLREAGHCCGSAGIHNLLEPESSDAVLARKLDAIAESGAEVVATGNPGCLMQIGAGLLLGGARTVAVHPVELVARESA
jgi:glycolate oxidase iron-sulfur subunit